MQKNSRYCIFCNLSFFDLQIASNNLAYINIIIYFLDSKKNLYTIIFVIQYIYANYSKKNQVKAFILIINKYALKKARPFYYQ